MVRALYFLFLSFPLVFSAGGLYGTLEDIPDSVRLPYIRSDKLLGTWYRFANFIPCSWSGASQFSDGVSKILVDKDDPNFIKVVNTWRSEGMCAERIEKISRAGIENNTVVSYKSLGGMGSGLRARVAVQYNEYDINYGCAREDFDNPKKCNDPSLGVFVRHPKPGRRTVVKINNQLKRLFGITLRDLVIQKRSGKSCPSSC